MKFLADECCETGLVASLRKDGHNVLYITEEKAGAIDDEILSNAYKEGVGQMVLQGRFIRQQS